MEKENLIKAHHKKYREAMNHPENVLRRTVTMLDSYNKGEKRSPIRERDLNDIVDFAYKSIGEYGLSGLIEENNHMVDKLKELDIKPTKGQIHLFQKYKSPKNTLPARILGSIY